MECLLPLLFLYSDCQCASSWQLANERRGNAEQALQYVDHHLPAFDIVDVNMLVDIHTG